MVLELFKKPKYVTIRQEGKREIPEGLWVKCPRCEEIVYNKDLLKNLKVCPKCGFHFRLTAAERLDFTLDEGSFVEYDADLVADNPLDFPGYPEKLAEARQVTGLAEAIITGEGTIAGHRTIIGVMDPRFIMASMGAAVGEKIVRAVGRACERRLPLIIFVASGGARMQEGVVALLQMAKTAAAIKRLDDAGLLYIPVLTDPTTGGVSASFGMLGDIILAEPGALIGFTGPRVIEQTIKQKLPEGFQRAEFLQEHGMIDLVVPRPKMRETLARILKLHEWRRRYADGA
ncbi:acetyl-CoA carboxylase carboxyl transferase subunit beta [Thermodesulfitimonas autotrophica]|uniref:Acetyl-coenzyme A carboxylase carboxyl transferase subunit beta n=1 Tax=Thermodesulfitimonas autotrophica TaxID=1894989 RepID=A0A3N5AX60_9THEO|nr:acetyl-CoA carboxylase, carboxyltransferase subunit beta [Thermodesulfitimonas autotrophica]RPF49846.1 acetyl-CoA carboxylase carboxyl transferase subunit beta [Thermodesulfitimonas autotrophica]